MGMKELPLATRVLIASVSLFNSWWPVIPGFFLLLFLVYLISRKNLRVRYLWDNFWSYFPLVGVIFRSSQLAFFFEYSSLLTAGGIHIIRTLELMEESVNHQVLKEGIHDIKKEIIAGDSMSESISKLKFFEPFVLRMVKVGEQTGNMPEQFLILADYYMKKVNNLVEMMSKTLEPLIISIAGLVFLVIILGLLGPIYDLISTIK
jgi:type II secretory pathway component PulF